MPPKSSSSSALAAGIPIVIVERNGDLRASSINAYNPLELAKKCKLKTASGFEIRAEWAYSGSCTTDERFMVELWAREDGAAGQENKYEFPPPVDTILFFGACALVAKDMSSRHSVIPLTLDKWDKMYNFLFGGFDSLVNGDEDDDEEDELDSIPAHRKTKDGYLKDGFVVDSGDDDDEDDETDETDDEEEETDEDDKDVEDDDDDDNEDNDDDDADDDCVAPKHSAAINSKKVSKKREKKQPREEILVDTSSELSEEAYEYLDD